MHKLILFLLVSSLVMLLPFGISMNIISKAMALNIVSSINNDEQNYLQRYAKFYEDDKFREAYYNYHKQHHQQLENEGQSNSQESQPQQHHHNHHQQIGKEKQQSISQKPQQQNLMTELITQQKNPSGISQEQMHQQQIANLKQFLEAVR
jgi:hypothetical protein